MPTLRFRRYLAAMAKERQEFPRNKQSQNSAASWNYWGDIAQVSGKIEGWVTEKLFEEFSRTESRILGALSELDAFRLNPQIRTFS